MPEVTWAGAFAAGLLSFLSPCILPIVPFYLSYLAGVGMNQITAEEEVPAGVRRRAVMSALFFSAGILTIFMALGASASAFGSLVNEYMGVLRIVAAVIIVAMGLHFLGIIRIGFLYRQFRADAGDTSNVSLAGAYVIGLAFAFGWTPCVGPVLAAILLTVATDGGGMGQGAAMLFVYGLGMTLPFVIAALFIGPFMRWMKGFRRHLPTVEKAMGVLLIAFGVLIGTNSVNLIAEWMLNYMPAVG
ncbi:cytochrome c biogenesis CcdA family protein [Tropicimonas isoalkanivorans]|uniref:Cytochrome c-type biogenesis protein n=1 Tax=Tropicimonas isoalkanivorans TaxID=441112 RepID=A0A1I1PCJ2_9RHOB|nr:cytochrome c biogenesis protein CcdA [Tropicimonas isoalkanivorans]SFD05358.1 cytochrome c-type biogenesis protein [Tropicimonas isoalkanivorans]